jgi:transcriptional regulator with XRE-family HTH domain
MPPIETVRANGAAIRALRQKDGLSINQLAENADVALSALSYYENEKKDPSLRILIKIARALGVPVAAICKDELTDLPSMRRAS